MSTSITPDIMLAALKRWGLTPKFYKPDWKTHNRTAVQGWGPLYGFIVHNFASDGGDAGQLDYLYRGDPLPPPRGRNLPGPLSQFAITDDGQLWVIGWGTANHAGTVDTDTHNLIVKDAMPRDRDVEPNTSGSSTSGTVKGGPRYIGVEMTYGNKGPTAKQLATCKRLAAAMAEMLGGTGGSVAGHRECTTTRSDPQGIPSMGAFRKDVDALLKAGPGASASSATPSKPAGPVLQAPKPTVCTVALSTKRILAGAKVTVTAAVTPVVPGRFIFEWSYPGKNSWSAFGGEQSVTNGRASVVSTPGADIVYRAKFYPSVKGYAADWAPNVPLSVITAADVEALEDKVAELSARLAGTAGVDPSA